MPGTLSSRWSSKERNSVSGSGSGALSTSSSEATGVRVAVRIRPLLAREVGQRQGVRASHGCVTLVGLDRQERSFAVDHVLDSRPPEERGSSEERCSLEPDVSQEMVYEVLGVELVSKTLEGYNTCMLAYGHTGSGKTYTMMGSEFTRDLGPDELSQCTEAKSKGVGTPRIREKLSPLEKGPTDDAFDMQVSMGSGLIPRTLAAIFAGLHQEEPTARCIASFYELHNERVRDLLAPSCAPKELAWQDGGSGGQPRPQSKTTVHFHPRFGAFVAGVEEVPCADAEEVLRLVSFGSQARSTAATMMNESSSRSHAIFSLRMERAQWSNSIMLVDLAGREQERLSMCRTERFKELTLINRSLFHLARCVRELAASQERPGAREGQWHHFRNSKLTMVLGHALAGNSQTAVVGTVSPAQNACEDSLATLRFCESVKQVRTKPVLPMSQREAVVIELQDEVRRLELELLRARSGRAIVERQLGEAQAMMEHYRSSWEEALELSGHAVVQRLRQVPCSWDPPLPGVIPFTESFSGDWSPSSSQVASSSPLPSFWPRAEAGTGGPPLEDEGGSWDDSCSVPPSIGSQLVEREIPPLPLNLVEAPKAEVAASECSQSFQTSPRCPEKRILESPSPAKSPTRAPSTPQAPPRQVVTMASQTAPVASSGSCRMVRPSVVYNVPARVVAQPMKPAPTDELLRACEQSLAEAERSPDWRKQELAVTLRQLRSQLIDLNAPRAALRSRSPGSEPRPRGSRTLSPVPTPSTPLVQLRPTAIAPARIVRREVIAPAWAVAPTPALPSWLPPQAMPVRETPRMPGPRPGPCISPWLSPEA